MSGLFLCAALLATAWSTASATPLLLAVRRATALAEFTTANVGARLALRIERRTLVKAVIREPIRGGLLQDSGGLTADEAAKD